MINWATEEEILQFAHFDFRILNKYDFPEFASAYRESIGSMSTFLDLGYFSQQRSYLDMLQYFQQLIRSRTVDIYGIFDGKKLLGVANYYWTKYSDNGTQITLWIREGSKNSGIGTYFMRRLTSHALYEKHFRFVELVIDEVNHPSRRMAEKVGYELMEILDVETQGKMGSGKYCRYVLFDGEIESMAMNYHMQPIDLIDHPAYEKEFRYLIHDKWINDYLAWPWQILNERKYEGVPFGLELDRLMYEASIEEEEIRLNKRATLRSKLKLNMSRSNLGWAIQKRK